MKISYIVFNDHDVFPEDGEEFIYEEDSKWVKVYNNGYLQNMYNVAHICELGIDRTNNIHIKGTVPITGTLEVFIQTNSVSTSVSSIKVASQCTNSEQPINTTKPSNNRDSNGNPLPKLIDLL